jgi:hypothetical protein
MDADGRRLILCSVVMALISAGFLTPARSQDIQSQLGAEIERRFTATPEEAKPERIIDSAFPLTREIEKSRSTIQPLKLNFEFEYSQPSIRFEGIESLPQPTLVEYLIANGIPSGKLSRDARVRDDSYFLASKRGDTGSFTIAFNR